MTGAPRRSEAQAFFAETHRLPVGTILGIAVGFLDLAAVIVSLILE